MRINNILVLIAASIILGAVFALFAGVPSVHAASTANASFSSTLSLGNPQIIIPKPTIDLGQSETVTANVTGDLGSPLTYQWAENGNPIPGNSNTTTVTGTSVGIESISVLVENPCTCQRVTGTGSVMVNSLPTISIYPNITSIEAGQSVTFSNVTTPGTPGYLYSYTTNAPDAVINGNTIIFPTAGTYDVVEYVQDGTGANVPSISATIIVNSIAVVGPPLGGTLISSPSNINSGQSVELTATASGGSGNYLYTFSDTNNDLLVSCNTGLFITSTNAICFDSPASNDIYTVTIFDGANSVSPSNAVTVNATSAAPANTGGRGGTFTGGLPAATSTTTIPPTLTTFAPTGEPTSNNETTNGTTNMNTSTTTNSLTTGTNGNVPGNTITPTNAVVTAVSGTAVPAPPPSNATPSSFNPWLIAGIIILVVAILLLLFLTKRTKKKKGRK